MVAALDRREQILIRLMELMAEQYIAATTVVRNRGLLSNDARPAVAILDGDERIRAGDGLGRGSHVSQGSQLMVMTPELYVIPKTKKPDNTGIGTDVNAFRMNIVRVISQDETLLGLLGTNGSITYIGMVTDLKSGANLDGQCRLDFSFVYVLDPFDTLVP